MLILCVVDEIEKGVVEVLLPNAFSIGCSSACYSTVYIQITAIMMRPAMIDRA